MSLVYNNDRPIGKCESYSVDKIPGTTPFVMLTDYEPFRSELNENQQNVLEWLQAYSDKDSGDRPIQSIWYFLDLAGTNRLGIDSTEAFLALSRAEQFQVLAAFADWGLKEVAE